MGRCAYRPHASCYRLRCPAATLDRCHSSRCNDSLVSLPDRLDATPCAGPHMLVNGELRKEAPRRHACEAWHGGVTGHKRYPTTLQEGRRRSRASQGMSRGPKPKPLTGWGPSTLEASQKSASVPSPDPVLGHASASEPRSRLWDRSRVLREKAPKLTPTEPQYMFLHQQVRLCCAA